ncbi:MAG: AMP-binding protein, partial [Acidobacteriaceae bacterium]
FRQEVLRRAGESRVRASLLQWALGRGRRQHEALLGGHTPDSTAWKLADRLVLRKIQQGFGGRVDTFISGGAPLGLDTATWFLDAGVVIQEGYGLTETSPVIALNSTLPVRLGSVGKVLPNVEVRIEPDGELLVRGPSIFKGYWNKPQETADSFQADDWFATGDIGRIDDDGFLFITDRKKDLLKTSGGKLIAPQPIENQLKADPLVGTAAVVGDRHKFAAVLISPNFAALEAWAKDNGIAVEDRARLIADSAVEAAYAQIVAGVNARLANFETLKRFRLVAEEWTLDTGELTPSMKLKRRVVEQKYAAEIANFYEDEATSHR